MTSSLHGFSQIFHLGLLIQIWIQFILFLAEIYKFLDLILLDVLGCDDFQVLGQNVIED